MSRWPDPDDASKCCCCKMAEIKWKREERRDDCSMLRRLFVLKKNHSLEPAPATYTHKHPPPALRNIRTRPLPALRNLFSCQAISTNLHRPFNPQSLELVKQSRSIFASPTFYTSNSPATLQVSPPPAVSARAPLPAVSRPYPPRVHVKGIIFGL